MRGIVDSCYELEFFFHVVCVCLFLRLCLCVCGRVYACIYTKYFFLKVMKQSHSDLKIAILATIRDFTYCAQVAVLVGIVAAVVVAVADVAEGNASRGVFAPDLI